MKKYKLYDIYEDEREKIGEYDTPQQVAKACNDYAGECDNKWIPYLIVGDAKLKKYIACENWHYNAKTIIFK